MRFTTAFAALFLAAGDAWPGSIATATPLISGTINSFTTTADCAGPLGCSGNLLLAPGKSKSSGTITCTDPNYRYIGDPDGRGPGACVPKTDGALAPTWRDPWKATGPSKIKPGFTFAAHVLSVYDGDTMDVAVNPFPKKKGFNLTMERRLRVARINAPEMDAEDPKPGIKARDWVRSKVQDKDVVVVLGRSDPYERDIAEVYFEEADKTQKNLSDEELRLGLAQPYPPKGAEQ